MTRIMITQQRFFICAAICLSMLLNHAMVFAQSEQAPSSQQAKKTAAKKPTKQTLPRIELGVGLAAIYTNEYRGSKESRSGAFPVPYLVYRGKILKANRRGVRAELYENDKLAFNISMNGSVSSSSTDNPLRRGMPRLDPSFELGPSVNFKLVDDRLLFRLPVRAVYTVNSDGIDYIGNLFNPNFLWHGRFGQRWRYRYTAGFYFADDDYHDYYYAVDPQFVTATRPAYVAEGGYSGFSNQITVSRRQGKWWLGGFLRYDNLSGTNFLDSPLVETKNFYTMGLAATWIFGNF